MERFAGVLTKTTRRESGSLVARLRRADGLTAESAKMSHPRRTRLIFVLSVGKPRREAPPANHSTLVSSLRRCVSAALLSVPLSKRKLLCARQSAFNLWP